jgi:hypothetical protein
MSSLVSRRNFLASAAAAGTLAHAAPSSLLASLAADAPAQPSLQSGVLDLSRSPYAKVKNIPIAAVEIGDGFWAKRRKTNVESSIPSMHDELLAHGRMDNFLRLQGKSQAPQRGPVYSDSDIYKWAEAVGFALQSGDRPALRTQTAAMLRDVVAIQEPSGYLNSYYQDDRKPLRMEYRTQQTGHELYNIGHMLQGAIAWYRATGDRSWLDAGIRFVDGFLLPGFGPGKDQKAIVSGHPEIEMALVELYRTTGKRAYLELAGYILHGDERVPLPPQATTYMFCGYPFTERTHLEGHAVRAMYACCGATDYYLETGDPAYWKTLTALWEDLQAHQIYVNGGVGARQAGEAFGDAYELPNAQAYGESCAAIGMMMWNWRMLAATGDAKFTDTMERALYNGINSGMSLDGRTYCYRNPLAFDPSGDSRDRHAPEGAIRNPWYDTTCCPPNLERTFAALPGYFFGESADGLWVHLYDNATLRWHLADGSPITLEQQTLFPWEGQVRIAVRPAQARAFALHLRIPGWSRKSAVLVNGKPVEGVVAGSYLALNRTWTAGDTVELSFDMTPHMLKSNPAVAENLGRVAFERGPVVFCMEHLDQPAQAETVNLLGYTAALEGRTSARYAPDLLDGVVVLEHPGTLHRVSAETPLYYDAHSAPEFAAQPTTLRLIPYYAWANRTPSAMQVWIPYRLG